MEKFKDVYEMVLIAPIRRAKNVKEVRARERAARVKLERHHKAGGISFGDGLTVLDRIAAAAGEEIAKLSEERAHRKTANPTLR